MAETVSFRRLEDLRDLAYHPDAPGDPAWYWRNLDRDVFAPHVVVRCVHGVGATLSRKHAVDATGVVTPSLQWRRYDETKRDDVDGCCHIMGVLLGWTAEDAARRASL